VKKPDWRSRKMAKKEHGKPPRPPAKETAQSLSPDRPKEQHVRDYILLAIGALAEYWAVTRGASSLAYLAAFFFSLAFYDYSRSRLTSYKRIVRWGAPAVATALIVTGTFLMISRRTVNRPAPAAQVAAVSTPSSAPVTLESLFKSDFPNLMKITKTAEPTTFENGDSVVVTSQEYADFAARSSFLGHYIPATPLTFRVCVRLANSSYILLDSINKGMGIQTFDASGTTLKDLKFSGRVFIYHEWPLTLRQKSTLVDYYASKHLAVEFRGIDYLQNEEMARKLQAQQGK